MVTYSSAQPNLQTGTKRRLSRFLHDIMSLSAEMAPGRVISLRVRIVLVDVCAVLTAHSDSICVVGRIYVDVKGREASATP